MDFAKESDIILAASGDKAILDVRGLNTVAIQVFGSMSATLQIEGTVDGTNWFALNATPISTAIAVTSITAAGIWFSNCSGLLSVRVRCSAYTSGTPSIIIRGVRGGISSAAGVIGGSVDSSGNQNFNLVTAIAGEDIPNDVQKVETRASYANITTNTTTLIKTGVGVLYGFTVNNVGFTTAGTITVYDNTAASGTKIGTWTIPLMPPGTVSLATTFFPAVSLNAAFTVGCTFVTATTAPAPDITVLYR